MNNSPVKLNGETVRPVSSLKLNGKLIRISCTETEVTLSVDLPDYTLNVHEPKLSLRDTEQAHDWTLSMMFRIFGTRAGTPRWVFTDVLQLRNAIMAAALR